ncbi:MAG: hypothetical protein KDB00_23815 [Planctomycetales bacterium]|nr:hypothetical protein [Planctomycetales bacterium]
MRYLIVFLASSCVFLSPRVAYPADPPEVASANELNVLFIGNSYTARHNLAEVVQSMTRAGQPGVKMNVKSVIYGGRRLVDHWRLGTQNIVTSSSVTEDEIRATAKRLEDDFKKDPDDKYAKYAAQRQRKLIGELDESRTTWDVIVLQSYRDDLDGDHSLYCEYAAKFAELAKPQGAKVVLYETTPETQNAEPLDAAPDSEPVMKKAKSIATLANQIDAAVAPMSLVGLKCQTQRPDLTLRFVNDAHLNQTMAYLSACAIYAAMFDADPRGLDVRSITDIRYWQDKDRTKDRDNLPITKVFSVQDRSDLQRIAWEGYQEMKQMRARLAED